jgi:hypothetical protein
MVYLLHFSRGYKHARHFVGATDRVDDARQLAAGVVPTIDHPLLNAARLSGITFSVAQTWPGDEAVAAKLRAAGNHTKLCRACALERRD